MKTNTNIMKLWSLIRVKQSKSGNYFKDENWKFQSSVEILSFLLKSCRQGLIRLCELPAGFFHCQNTIYLFSAITGELTLPPAPIFMMISTDGALCSFKMVNKFKNANHKIMLPRSPMKTDNIRKPLVSTHNVPKSSSQPAFGAQSLPKPFGDNSNPVQSTKGLI